MHFETLDVKKGAGPAWIIVDRPDKLNALDALTIGELTTAFEAFERDPEVRAVILTGSGDRAFIAGADIAELSDLDARAGREYILKGQDLTRRIERCGKPVIAAINGFALGGGLEMALACHLRIAADSARMGQPEVKLGLIPGYGGTQRLSRLVGKGAAMELVLSGRMIDAAEALRIGLVNRVVPRAELRETCSSLAGEIIANGPRAVALAVRAVNEGLDRTLDEGLELEADLFGEACGTEDSREGTRAFLEKRKPEFKGR